MSRQSLDFDAYYQQYAATSEMLEDTIIDWYDIYQRVFDVLLSTIGIMMSIPFIVIFGIAVKLDSPGPVFYTQERVGKLVSNYVRNFHRVSKWFKPPGGSPEFVQG